MKKQSIQFCFAQYRFKIYPSFRCTGSLRPLGSLLSVEETSSRNLRKKYTGKIYYSETENNQKQFCKYTCTVSPGTEELLYATDEIKIYCRDLEKCNKGCP